jgi:hypothetical protein
MECCFYSTIIIALGMSQPRILIRTQYADSYKNIPVSAFFANSSDKGFEITAYVDEEDFAPAPMEIPAPGAVFVKRTIETRLTISPMQTKALYALLGNQIRAYEEVFGSIPTLEEVQAKVAEQQKLKTATTTSGNSQSAKGNVGIQ